MRSDRDCVAASLVVALLTPLWLHVPLFSPFVRTNRRGPSVFCPLSTLCARWPRSPNRPVRPRREFEAHLEAQCRRTRRSTVSHVVPPAQLQQFAALSAAKLVLGHLVDVVFAPSQRLSERQWRHRDDVVRYLQRLRNLRQQSVVAVFVELECHRQLVSVIVDHVRRHHFWLRRPHAAQSQHLPQPRAVHVLWKLRRSIVVSFVAVVSVVAYLLRAESLFKR